MKPSVRSLKLGQTVWALVEEHIAGGEVVINMSGDLLRVQNNTGRRFRFGERVQLRVTQLFPLTLALAPARAQEPTRLLDTSV